MPALGSHCVLELYDCPAAVLDDVDAVLAALKTATDDAGATLLQLSHHRFAPQGLTALALLSESHISVHTWPERGYAACDVFTCGRETRPEAACMALVEALQCERYVLRRFPRGQELPQMLGGRASSPDSPR